jgi:hypothetical protein
MPMTHNSTHLDARGDSNTATPPALATLAMTLPGGRMAPGVMARSLFRVASVTFDRDDRVAGATAVASGACLDFVLSAAPGVRAEGDSPATLTMARADILRLRRAAGTVAGTDPRRVASGPVWNSLYGLTEGEGD